MPSLTHEGLITLFRNRPDLAPELLRDMLGMSLPAYAEARISSADLPEVEPTEYRADLVVLLLDDKLDHKPVFGIVLEIQLDLKEADRKFFTWPVYGVNLRAHLECETCVLVITPSEEVAERARRPIVLGPCGTFTPLVVGRSAIPVVTDIEQVRRDIEVAVLSAMAHGTEDVGLQIATAVFEGCRSLGLDQDRAMLYYDLVGISLSDAARVAFEKLMANYEFQTEFGKRYQASLVAAKEEARAEGRVEGKAEGRVEGKAEGILRVLEVRRLPVDGAQRARILRCTELDVLDRWLARAVVVAATSALFE